MLALIISREFNDKKSNIKNLEKALINNQITYDIVSFGDIEDFYEKIKQKKIKKKYNLLISYGGDGTVLKSARIAKKLDVPILGINAGTLGFLTSIDDTKDISTYIKRIKKKDYICIERGMLDIKVLRNKKVEYATCAVNEATIFSKELSKMGKYEMFIGDENGAFNEYNADGLIVATPTGSTGHSLSAGGPIVSPEVKCFIITAICPHSFNQRSVLVGDSKKVLIKVMSDKQAVDIDGRVNFALNKEDYVEVTKFKKAVKYITFEKNHFINNLKNKIKNI